jgi:hypothetical protein
MDRNTRCPGTGQDARNVRNLSSLGSKYFGKFAGECRVCGADVLTRKGTRQANPHRPAATS